MPSGRQSKLRRLVGEIANGPLRQPTNAAGSAPKLASEAAPGAPLIPRFAPKSIPKIPPETCYNQTGIRRRHSLKTLIWSAFCELFGPASGPHFPDPDFCGSPTAAWSVNGIDRNQP